MGERTRCTRQAGTTGVARLALNKRKARGPERGIPRRAPDAWTLVVATPHPVVAVERFRVKRPPDAWARCKRSREAGPP